MADSTPRQRAGTLFQYGDGGTPTEVFTTVPGVRGGVPVGNISDTLDVSPDDLPVGEYEYLDVEPDAEKGTLMVNDMPGDATQQAFLAVVSGRTECNCKVVLPNGREGDMRLKFLGYKVPTGQRKEEIKLEVHYVIIKQATWTITP